MRDLVELFFSVAATNARPRKANLLEIESFDLGRDIEEALRSQKEAGTRSRWISNEPQVSGQLGQMFLRAGVEVGRAPFRIEAGGDRQALHQRGFPAAVLAHEDRHTWVERQRVDVANRSQIERVAAAIRPWGSHLEGSEKRTGRGLPLR